MKPPLSTFIDNSHRCHARRRAGAQRLFFLHYPLPGPLPEVLQTGDILYKCAGTSFTYSGYEPAHARRSIMPRKEQTAMSQKLEWIARLAYWDGTFARLRESFGISRVTGYQWRRRHVPRVWCNKCWLCERNIRPGAGAKSIGGSKARVMRSRQMFGIVKSGRPYQPIAA